MEFGYAPHGDSAKCLCCGKVMTLLTEYNLNRHLKHTNEQDRHAKAYV